MRTLLVLCVLSLAAAGRDVKGVGRTFLHSDAGVVYPVAPRSDRVAIDSVGNIRAILGSQGKSIIVSGGGEAIGVLYGKPSGITQNMVLYAAYSLNGGATWTMYGPFSSPSWRIYNDIAGTSNFHTNPGRLWYVYQSCTQGYNDVRLNVMIQENVPAAPSFSVPITPPNACAPATYPWEPTITVMQDDPTHLVVSAYSYLTAGNMWAYAWVSTDGEYTWSDTIPMVYISADGAAGTLAAGTNEYVFYGFLDYYTFSGTDSTPYPHYMESTDGGYTWSAETPITVFPANTSSQYWWHEFDCLVINDEPWVVFNDIGAGGTGGPHIARATGSPGNWNWTLWHQDVIGHDSTWRGDTLYYCAPSQYPSLSYDPVSGRILASCKSYIYIGDLSRWALYNGAHIQGVYTWDGGSTWRITSPLSTANTGEIIIWDDWNATETADWLVDSSGYSKTYSIWVHEDPATGAGILYFESGLIDWSLDWPTAVEENAAVLREAYEFVLQPSVTSGGCRANVTMPAAGEVSLRLCDVTGRMLEQTFCGYLTQGAHRLDINTKHLAGGAYFVMLETDAEIKVKKLIVAR